MCLTCPNYRHANPKLSLSPFSSPRTGEGMVAALTWMAPPIHPYPMPNSVTDLTAEILQTEVACAKSKLNLNAVMRSSERRRGELNQRKTQMRLRGEFRVRKQISTRLMPIEEYQRSARRVRNRKTGGARRNRTVASSRLKRQEFSQLSADKNKSHATRKATQHTHPTALR